jgi:hypothetical protein
VISAAATTARNVGRRTRQTAPATPQGIQAAVVPSGNMPQAMTPPPSAKPAPASSEEKRRAPALRASSQAPSKPTRTSSASSTRKWWRIGASRASMASGESTCACGFAQGELPPSRRFDQSGSR